ncbi:MAG TPA: crossover junction endodeoxyribonuclease RuvC [bacterium]|nr:crossover junction endodeoxyribonuclease RuvC [bacterium]
MKILGIDPGVNRVGYGLIEKKDTASREEVLLSGTIIPPARLKYEAKLEFILSNFDRLLEENQPDIIAIEEIYLGKNVQVTLKIGQITGILAGASVRKGIPFKLLSAREVKQNITGTGAATKEQVRFMLEHLTGYRNFQGMDESDAVAVAVSYLTYKKENDLLHLR